MAAGQGPPPREAACHGGQYREERALMVRRQISQRGVKAPRVLAAMGKVPRHCFVPARQRESAYADHPLPIGQGQTISQPYVVALMSEALKLTPQDKVLEIGTGSGYQAAVLAELAGEVYSIEIVEELGKRAAQALAGLGYGRVRLKIGDGYQGWPQAAPFDAIILTAAPPKIPQALVEQLAPGGRMILPLGPRFGVQELLLITKGRQGVISRQSLGQVRFVPMMKSD
ncbi:protein-L-isoaspartate O-methyltransferase [Desulfocarbo indianensis]|nr:protein-L-isoaspartate O-methyltransferase [Desulfocarbo indianensis]